MPVVSASQRGAAEGGGAVVSASQRGAAEGGGGASGQCQSEGCRRGGGGCQWSVPVRGVPPRGGGAVVSASQWGAAEVVKSDVTDVTLKISWCGDTEAIGQLDRQLPPNSRHLITINRV